MTVRELIERLQHINPEALALVEDHESGCAMEIENIMAGRGVYPYVEVRAGVRAGIDSKWAILVAYQTATAEPE